MQGEIEDAAFRDSQASSVAEDVQRGKHGPFRRRESQDPIAEIEPLEKATHGGQLEMAVGVDEARQEKDVAEVHVIAGRSSGS